MFPSRMEPLRGVTYSYKQNIRAYGIDKPVRRHDALGAMGVTVSPVGLAAQPIRPAQ
jgi:hypothetical protein